MGLSIICVICICIHHCILLCIDIYIRFILFICVSLVSIIDYIYIDAAVRYLPLVFPILSPFLCLCHNSCGQGNTALFTMSAIVHRQNDNIDESEGGEENSRLVRSKLEYI